ncbi:MAG: sigma-54-dependent Fis family transcriptional regulator [Myxococcales bacterium]|nr:sigma-54-dependent Fis family transcriptional regulator [Myxococcales bacterium]
MLLDIDPDALLHAADIEGLEREIVALACQRADAHDGAIFLWDTKAKGLAVDFHVVDDVVVTLPGSILRPRVDGRPNGIALTCFDSGRSYLCNDTARDRNYARYFLDVGSVLAVPIPWQGRAIGVLSVSAKRAQAFTARHTAALEQIAGAAAKHLRRAQLARATRKDTGRPFLIKGLSAGWLEVERRIEQVSATDAPVLVHGESGTGKDLVSRALHFNSRRAQAPYVTVNCAAIPETMLESVLFGHVRGAFTGATGDKIGEFVKADGGTLFLDELGELPLTLQAKVLRAVEQGEVSPLGSNKAPGRVDVRLVCATNRDLPQMVREGRFRDDLYYRISVVTLELPPLRSYKDNLEILAHVLLRQAAERHGRKVSRISPAAMAVLLAYDFPGNVRELKNALEHAAILSTSDQIEPADLPRSMHEAQQPVATPVARRSLLELREEWVAPHERRYLLDLLNECGGRVRDAAERAQINHVTLYRLMRKHGLVLDRAARARG